LSRLGDIAAAGDYAALEDAWLDRLQADLDPEEAADVFRALDGAGESDRAAQLLDIALDALSEEGAQVGIDFLRAAAPCFDGSPRLRELVVEMLRDEYLMYEPLERFLKSSGLMDGQKSLRECWARIGELLRYRRDGWVLHFTMGPGRITRITRDSATIDFEKAHSFDISLDALLDSSKPVSSDGPPALRRRDPAAWSALAQDPSLMLQGLLDEFGGKVTRRLVTAMAGQDEGADLWKKLASAASSDPGIVALGDSVERKQAAPPDVSIVSVLSTGEPLVARNREMARQLRALDAGTRQAVSEKVSHNLPRLRTPESGALYEMYWLLAGEPQESFAAPGAPVELTPGRATRALAEITSPVCRKLYATAFVARAEAGDMKALLDQLQRNLWFPAMETAFEKHPVEAAEYAAWHLSNRSDPDLHLRVVEFLILHPDLAPSEDWNPTMTILETAGWARAESARKVITALLEARHDQLVHHLKSLDTRRLGMLSEQLSELGPAQDTGLLLEVMRELSQRRSGVDERPRFWQSDFVYASPSAIARRHDELIRLKSEEIPAAARAIKEAASHGDLSENAEYAAALERRDLLLDALRRGTEQFDRLRPYPRNDMTRSVCSPGTKVLLESEEGRELEFQVVGPLEAAPEDGRVNYLAPMGAAVLGTSPGDSVSFPGNPGVFVVKKIEILPEVTEQ